MANVFHAGDGNLHPLVLYDDTVPESGASWPRSCAGDILRLCITAGGSITRQHGVGEEKKMFMSEMYAEPDLETMQLVRCAFDPENLSNPNKIFPRPRLCGERPGVYEPHPLEIAGGGATLLAAGGSTDASRAMTQVSWSEQAEIVGQEHLRAATTEDSIDGIAPQRIAEPGTAEDLAGCLRWAPQRGRQGDATPRGGARSWAGGNPPACLRSPGLDDTLGPRPRACLGRHDGHRRSRMPCRQLARGCRSARPAVRPRPAVAGAGYRRRHPPRPTTAALHLRLSATARCAT